MSKELSFGFAEWLSTVASAVDGDAQVRKALMSGGPLKIQFNLPVKFFVVGCADHWAVGLGELYRPSTVFESDFDAFAELLQGRWEPARVKLEGDVQALTRLFGALSKMQEVGMAP